ncbi:MAG: VWA domain-containing protein [Bryobacterales bacterium]|nr:VWA domain-containing protein [Bryobacterales bacterium]MDE0264566.1 VWA domain-containing protein [Bryobacterales bacterium]MDE0622917.1 VWA domain-containing protein [Bryobacterales bacterium]
MKPTRVTTGPIRHALWRTSRGVAAAAALISWAAPLWGQPASVFRSETALLELEVRVTDRRGQPVAGLSRDDFELRENGHPQAIATFEFVAGLEAGEAMAAPGIAQGRPGQPGTDAASQLRRSTFVYIATRGRREDRPQIYDAVRDFVDNDLQPGMLVSIQGSPFTSRRSELYERLDAMRQGGNASDGFVDTLAVDLARDIAYSDAFEDLIADTNEEFEEALEEIADRSAFYNRLRMYEYIDLIRALSIYPGKKLVVLFATGLPVEEDNLDIIKVLEDEAMKARVRFYVSDVRRLDATPLYGDAETSGGFAAAGGAAAIQGLTAAIEQRQDNQDGLWELAQRTGGKAILNSNDFGEVFEVVNQENTGYYLLGYYPEDREQRGRLRRLRVRVNDSSLRISHQRGYYEERPFRQMSRTERNLRMHQALTFDTPYTDLPILVDHEFFRDSSGGPTLIYSVGLHARDIPTETVKKGETVKLTVIAQALSRPSDGGDRQPPVLDERRFTMTVDPAALERLGDDPASWLHYGSQMPLAPGEYDWKVVVRDDLSGSLGSYQTRLRIPKHSAGTTGSSLLLTSRIDDVGQAKAGKPSRKAPEDVLLVDGSRFFATAVKAFRRGTPIYLLYDVYNLGPGSYDDPPGPRLALYRERESVPRLPVKSYQTVPQPEAQRVRQLAALATDDLRAGEYILAAMLPPSSGEAAVIYQKFQIVDGDGR